MGGFLGGAQVYAFPRLRAFGFALFFAHGLAGFICPVMAASMVIVIFLSLFLLRCPFPKTPSLTFCLIPTISLFVIVIHDPLMDDFKGVDVRSKVSRVRNDQRIISQALESYYADHHAYPAWTEEPERRAAWQTVRKPGTEQPSFEAMISGAATLTTPMPYLSAYPEDIFSPSQEKRTFAYWVAPDDANWILWSPGPDMQFDLHRAQLEHIYNSDHTAWFRALIPYAYDPSNGIVSPGDIWRWKQ